MFGKMGTHMSRVKQNSASSGRGAGPTTLAVYLDVASSGDGRRSTCVVVNFTSLHPRRRSLGWGWTYEVQVNDAFRRLDGGSGGVCEWVGERR